MKKVKTLVLVGALLAGTGIAGSMISTSAHERGAMKNEQREERIQEDGQQGRKERGEHVDQHADLPNLSVEELTTKVEAQLPENESIQTLYASEGTKTIVRVLVDNTDLKEYSVDTRTGELKIKKSRQPKMDENGEPLKDDEAMTQEAQEVLTIEDALVIANEEIAEHDGTSLGKAFTLEEGYSFEVMEEGRVVGILHVHHNHGRIMFFNQTPQAPIQG